MMGEKSLKEQAVQGMGWSAADAFLSYGVTFIVGLVLARILTPEEYGLIGIVSIFTTVLMGFVDSGLSNSLIRKTEVTDEDYNTMFIVNMIMSILMFAFLYLCAPAISRFFYLPKLVPITRVMGLLIIFQALSIVQYTILSRRIDFKTKTKANVISAISSGVIGIAMAVLGYGVWSLVGQILSRQLIYSIILWILNRWRPRINFCMASFNYMWGFGWKLLLSSLLDRIWSQLYQTVVGRCYSAATLGQYSRSKDYANLLSVNFTGIVQRVSYPVLSKLQNDNTRLLSGYRRIIKCTMFITAISMIFLGAISEPLLYCLIGPQWQQASTFLPFICISMSLYPLHAINLNMLQVLGRTDIFLFLEIIKKIIAILPICLGVFVNIYWMLVGTIIIGIISFFLNSYYTGKKLGYSSWMQIKDITPSYGLAFFIALSVYFFKYLALSYWIVLPLQILVGAILFFVLCERSKMTEYLEAKAIAIKYLSKIRHK